MANKMQIITKFEVLPNEIVLECFEYLNGVNILYSFYLLNYRFHKLIQAIRLQLNFEHVRKTTFDQFCTKILLNSTIKRQIHSLRLSNADTCGQIEAFLSCFSLDEFTFLRSLTLIRIEKNNIDKLKSMSSLICQLCSLHLIDPDAEVKGELSLNRTSRVEILTQASTCHLPLLLEISSSLTNLTLSKCSCVDLSQLLEYAPNLKYLNIRQISRFTTWTNYYQGFSCHRAIHLKQLIMVGLYSDEFANLEMLMKQTPNLKSLMFSSGISDEIIDAPRWQRLITSSLHQLTDFKFEFYDNIPGNENTLFNKFKEFQNDFRQKQHHWYTEYYSVPRHLARICTIPYMSNTLSLHQNTTVLYYNDSPNEFNAFDNVIDLTFHDMDVMKKCPLHFSNVTTLRLKDSFYKNQTDSVLLGTEYFESLKMIVNLSNLKHLDIFWSFKTDMSLLLLQILKEAPQLSSLEIDSDSSVLSFSNDELCKYLNKIIKKMNLLIRSTIFINDDATEEFCKLFSNIEQLTCYITDTRYLLLLLKLLPNLSTMKVTFKWHDDPIDLSFFEDEAHKRNALFRIERINHQGEVAGILYTTEVTIWIGNNMK